MRICVLFFYFFSLLVFFNALSQRPRGSFERFQLRHFEHCVCLSFTGCASFMYHATIVLPLSKLVYVFFSRFFIVIKIIFYDTELSFNRYVLQLL